MSHSTPRKQSTILAPGFIYQNGAFLSPQEQRAAQPPPSRHIYHDKPRHQGEERAYSSPLQLEEVLRCARLFLSQHAHLAKSRKRRRGEGIWNPPIKTELGPDFGVEVTDDSEWLAANKRRKGNEPPKPPSIGRGTRRSPSTPNEGRVDSRPQGPRDRRKRDMTPEPSPDAHYRWEVQRHRRSKPKPEVHIYRRDTRGPPTGDVIRVAVPEEPAKKKPPGLPKRRRTARERPPETRPAKPCDREFESNPSPGELLSEERANRPSGEKQGGRHDIRDYSRMLSIAAEASRALKKDRESKTPPGNERSSPCPLLLPQQSPPKTSSAAPRQSTRAAPPRCQFPLHRYFTESPERVPDPSDLAGDPHQFWLGVHHLAECASAAHSPLMVGACKVLCKVVCTMQYSQGCSTSGTLGDDSRRAGTPGPCSTPSTSEKTPANPRSTWDSGHRTPVAASSAPVAATGFAIDSPTPSKTPKRSSESRRIKDLLRRRRRQRDSLAEAVERSLDIALRSCKDLHRRGSGKRKHAKHGKRLRG